MTYVLPTHIAEDVSVAVESFIHSTDLLSCFYSFGNLPALVLSERRHDCKPEFSVAIQRPDVVLHKEHFDIYVFKLSRCHKGIDRIPRKAADFTRYD